jgi:hypothetical protein
MKTFTTYAFLVVLALSQSPVLSIPSLITKGTNLDVIADTRFVARDLKVAKPEEASKDLEKRGLRACVSTALHLLSSSFLKAGKLGYIAN